MPHDLLSKMLDTEKTETKDCNALGILISSLKNSNKLMDLLYFKRLYKYALSNRNGEIMAIVEVWENVPNFLMKSFKIENKSLVFRTWKVKEKNERSKY